MGLFTTASNTWAVGNKITAALLNGQLRDLINGFGAYTAYTPTLGGGWIQGNGTFDCAYSLVNKQCDVNIVFTSGTTTTYGASSLTFTTPSGATPTKSFVGQCRVFDTSAGVSYTGEVLVTAGGTLTPLVTPAAAGGSNRGVTSTIPMTFATGDSVVVTARYEAA